MNKEIARATIDTMLCHGADLDKLLILIRDNCTEEEFTTYRRAIGKIMGYMLTDVMNPILEEHPDIRPNDIK